MAAQPGPSSSREERLNRKLIFPVLTLILAMLACGLPVAQTPPTATPVQPGPVTGPATNTPTLPSVPALTLDALRNATYQLPFYGQTVTLTDGNYRYESGPDLLDVIILNVYATGDLNGDGTPDAAVILGENGGGSGTFESVVVVFNENGTPVQAGAATLGDRVLVKSVVIQSGEIVLDMVVHGPNDPLCCPSFPTVQTYRMIGGYLWMTRLTSKIQDGTERSITVDEPANGADVNNPFTVSGGVTIAPFENNLACRVSLPDGTLVNETPLMVDAPDLGAPGTFSRQFDLGNAGITGPVIIQFVDVSMADGSTLALGSVVVNVR
jgi:hypothetical protein